MFGSLKPEVGPPFSNDKRLGCAGDKSRMLFVLGLCIWGRFCYIRDSAEDVWSACILFLVGKWLCVHMVDQNGIVWSRSKTISKARCLTSSAAGSALRRTWNAEATGLFVEYIQITSLKWINVYGIESIVPKWCMSGSAQHPSWSWPPAWLEPGPVPEQTFGPTPVSRSTGTEPYIGILVSRVVPIVIISNPHFI